MRLLFEKTLTFYNVNDTEAKQRRYMIGSGCVNRNGPTHAVSNNHDGRRVLSIDRLHHFANIPFERKARTTCLPCYISIIFVSVSEYTVRNC